MLNISCARVSSPAGGEKDSIPPTLINSVPSNGQLNFKDQIIYLEFDELVAPNQIESNLIITPKPNGSFKTRNSRNKIQLEFSEPFQDSTTYTLSFANSIQDLTEKNIPPGLTLSFSTGNYLDSLTISGQIRNLYDQIPEEGVLVSLYEASDSLTILNGSASYYTKTDTSGFYHFQNLPPNQYKVYAVIDKNNNSKADSEGEYYGFYTDTLHLSQNISDINFTVQRLSTKDLKLLKGRHFGKYYELSFNKSITSFEPLTTGNYLYHQTKEDIIRFYRTNELFNDTTELIFNVSDSLGTILIDTARYYFIESDIEPDQLLNTVTPRRSLFKPKESIILGFNKPTSLFNLDSIQIFVDSLNVFPITSEGIISNDNGTEYTIPFTIRDYIQRPDQKVTLEFKPGTFISIDSDTTMRIQKSMQIATEDETAVISGRVNTSASQVIVQLLKSSNLEVVEETTDKDFTFSYLEAGSYMIRAINDLNANGKWDIGNILNNEPPEPSAFYYDREYDTQLIEVRKNWERSQINISLR